MGKETDLEMMRHIKDQQQHKGEWFFLSHKLVCLLYFGFIQKTNLLKDKKITRSYSLGFQLSDSFSPGWWWFSSLTLHLHFL